MNYRAKWKYFLLIILEYVSVFMIFWLAYPYSNFFTWLGLVGAITVLGVTSYEQGKLNRPINNKPEGE